MSSDSSGGAATEGTQKLDKLDSFQQQHKPVAIPIAVFKKFSEDQSTNLASMIAFWAFFSIFPLLLVLVTLLGFFLPADTKTNVLQQVSSYIPLLNAKPCVPPSSAATLRSNASRVGFLPLAYS